MSRMTLSVSLLTVFIAHAPRDARAEKLEQISSAFTDAVCLADDTVNARRSGRTGSGIG